MVGANCPVTSVHIEGHDRPGLERLPHYCARPPFALERIERIDEDDNETSRRSPARSLWAMLLARL